MSEPRRAVRQRTYHVRLIDRETNSIYACSIRVFRPTKKRGYKIELNPTPGVFMCTGSDEVCVPAMERCDTRQLRIAELLAKRTFR